MTKENKDILIAKMLDSPSSLSDEELDIILNDEELKDIYDISSDVRSACIMQPEIDVEEEWKLFRNKIKRQRFPKRWIMRVAAIFLGVIFIGGSAGKIVDYFLTSSPKSVIAKVEQPDNTNIKAEHHNILPESESETIEISPSLNIDRQTAAQKRRYAVAVKSENEAKCHVSDVDIDELLRIEQARIDNDFAMLTAEEIIEEYDLFLQDYYLNYDTDDELINTINVLTMQ